MQHSLNSVPPSAFDLEFNPAFNVLIAYEDFETGKHARKTYEFLVEHLGQDSQFANQMWKFEVLQIPNLREMAARDAAMADVIVISGHGGSQLPAHVRLWIEAWLAAPRNAIALVALFDPPREHTQSIRTYLADVARRGKMAFFAQPDQWPAQESEATIAGQDESAHEQQTIAAIAVAAQRDLTVPQWEQS
jgi:hypothetical protein